MRPHVDGEGARYGEMIDKSLDLGEAEVDRSGDDFKDGEVREKVFDGSVGVVIPAEHRQALAD